MVPTAFVVGLEFRRFSSGPRRCGCARLRARCRFTCRPVVRRRARFGRRCWLRGFGRLCRLSRFCFNRRLRGFGRFGLVEQPDLGLRRWWFRRQSLVPQFGSLIHGMKRTGSSNGENGVRAHYKGNTNHRPAAVRPTSRFLQNGVIVCLRAGESLRRLMNNSLIELDLECIVYSLGFALEHHRRVPLRLEYLKKMLVRIGQSFDNMTFFYRSFLRHDTTSDPVAGHMIFNGFGGE